MTVLWKLTGLPGILRYALSLGLDPIVEVFASVLYFKVYKYTLYRKICTATDDDAQTIPIYRPCLIICADCSRGL
jgi:hypothetical protein